MIINSCLCFAYAALTAEKIEVIDVIGMREMEKKRQKLSPFYLQFYPLTGGMNKTDIFKIFFLNPTLSWTFTFHGAPKIFMPLFSSFKAVLSTGDKVEESFCLWSFEISLLCSILSMLIQESFNSCLYHCLLSWKYLKALK